MSSLRIITRRLVRNGLSSIINIIGLSIGLACCLLILLYTKDEYSFDSFHKKKGQLYQLTCHRFSNGGEDKKFAIAAMVQGPSFQRAIPEIKASVRVNPQQVVVKNGNETFNETATWTDDNFFSLFSFPLEKGNGATVLTDIHSAVLSEDLAIKYFGAREAVGQTLEVEMDGKFELFTVTGVAKPAPQNSSIQFTLLLPFKYLEEKHPDNGWMWVSYPTYFFISPKADIPAITGKMNQVFRAEAAEEIGMNKLLGYTDKFVWGLQPLEKMHRATEFEGNPGGRDPIYSYLLTGMAIFILLIACINFINLSIAQSLKRNREIGLRKVIGGRRIQLVQQFLGESFFLCGIAFLIALLLAEGLLPFFNELADKKLSLTYLFDIKLVAAIIGLYLLTGLAAGFYPALVVSGFDPVRSLYDRSIMAGKNYLGRALVILQFSLATFLIICTLFIYAQFDLLTKTSPGYNDKNVVEITVADAVMNTSLTNRIKTALAGTPGVENIAIQNVGKFGGRTIVAGKELNATYFHVDENYLSALQIPLLAGRDFSRDYPSDSVGAVLVNETFVKEAGLKNPVGKTIDYMNFPGWSDRKITITGIFHDYHFESLKERIKPEVLTLEPGMPYGKFLLKIKPHDIPAVLQSIESSYRKLLPFRPFEYRFKEDLNFQNYETESKTKQIIGFAAILIVLISCFGLYGLTALSIGQRIKEIGIRKVLGSGIFQIGFLLTKNFLLLVLLAVFIAIPAAWMTVYQWLKNFPYKIGISWWVFLLAGMATMLIALLTVSYQSAKAARMNPVKSLKFE